MSRQTLIFHQARPRPFETMLSIHVSEAEATSSCTEQVESDNLCGLRHAFHFLKQTEKTLFNHIVYSLSLLVKAQKFKIDTIIWNCPSVEKTERCPVES